MLSRQNELNAEFIEGEFDESAVVPLDVAVGLMGQGFILETINDEEE